MVEVSGTTIIVTDSGPGIDPADIPHVFDRFWRSDSARAMPGSGLGMSIVQRVITDHDGDVTIDANPGGGTRVRIDFPAVDAGRRSSVPSQVPSRMVSSRRS